MIEIKNLVFAIKRSCLFYLDISAIKRSEFRGSTVENIFEGHIAVNAESVSDRAYPVRTKGTWRSFNVGKRTLDVVALQKSPSVSIYATYEPINAGFQLVNSSTYLSRRTSEFGRKLCNDTHSMSKLRFPRTKFSIH